MGCLAKPGACKRCGGNLLLDWEGANYVLYCLQCSAVYFRKTDPLRSFQPAVRSARRPVPAIRQPRLPVGKPMAVGS